MTRHINELFFIIYSGTYIRQTQNKVLITKKKNTRGGGTKGQEKKREGAYIIHICWQFFIHKIQIYSLLLCKYEPFYDTQVAVKARVSLVCINCQRIFFHEIQRFFLLSPAKCIFPICKDILGHESRALFHTWATLTNKTRYFTRDRTPLASMAYTIFL